jgi:Icc-related predicted phosphoesterase
MKICIISDTHNKHKRLGRLPDADVIIHCGDFTSMGYEHEIRDFMKWYSNLNQYSYRICCAGNHDMLFERNGILAKSLVPKNVHYLEDSGVELDGINFYGSPVQPPFLNWAFMRPEARLELHWKAIPDDTDVLITHCPPLTIMDFVPWEDAHKGSPSLYWEVVERIKPKIHCFGHIHNGYGVKVIENTTFINAALCDAHNIIINQPIFIEI